MATEANTSGVGPAVEKRLSIIVRKLAFDISGRIVLAMRGVRTGRIYKKRRGSHQASAPGEAPAVETGTLRAAVSQAPRFPSPTEAELAIPVEYASSLEFGTAQMAARPFVMPAIEGALKAIGKRGVFYRISTQQIGRR